MLLVVYGTPALDTVIVNAPPEMGPAAVVVIVHTARLREAGHWMGAVDTTPPKEEDSEYLRGRHENRRHKKLQSST
jgi:hypothetical protein